MPTRPFTAPRPAAYAPVPPAVRRRDLAACAPGPSPSLPGALTLRFLADTPGTLLALHRRYGDAVAFALGGEGFVALFAPEMVHEVTVAQQHAFVKGVGFARMRKVLGEGLLTNEEPIHLRHRRMMQAPFHHDRLDAYAALMSRLARDEVAAWADGATVDLAPRMMALTLDIVARTLFGTDAHAHAEAIGEAMDVAIDRIERTMLPGLDRLDRVPLPWFRAFERSADRLADIAESLITARRERDRSAGGAVRDLGAARTGEDLLGLLLALRDDAGTALTDDEVRDEALTLILSGHETTANALTWALSYLATRPDVAAALAAEADRAEWLAGDATPTLDDLRALPVATGVLKEALRLAPPVWVAPRRALRDVDVAGVAIPAGAHVLVSQYVTHRDPRWYPDPHAFRPERWDDDLEGRLPRGSWFPFGAGSRKCLGDQFALAEGRIILLEVARHLTLEPVDPRRPMPRPNPRATYRARGPVRMRVRRR